MIQSFSPLSYPIPANHDEDVESEDDEDDVFHIPPKPSLEMLRKWRKATLALNALWRFHYTLDLKNKEAVKPDELKNEDLVSRFRKVTHALRALQRFKGSGQRSSEGPVPEGFEIGPSQLVRLMKGGQVHAPELQGGVQALVKLLKSNAERGIENDITGIEKRKEGFGSNKIPSKPRKSFLVFVWEACHDTTLIILLICAVVSFGTHMWSDGPKEGWGDSVKIGAAVLINIAVTATSDYQQSLQFSYLSDEKKNMRIEVIRGACRCRIYVYDVVVGDVVCINIGDQVPADGILISGQSLTVDESSLTGESMAVLKDAMQPFLLSGCKIIDGYGTMLVTAVGTKTKWGQVMPTLTEDNGEETPLQVRLNGVATFIGRIGLMVAVVVFIILIIRFFAVDFKTNKKSSNAIKKIVNSGLATAVAIVVLAVPEGLPLVTLTLACSVRRMMNDKALVRNLLACETMGSVTTICTDKTGTLTLNQMSVAKSWVAGKLMEPEDVKGIPTKIYKTLLAGICQNTSGSVFTPTDGGKPEVSGSPTESAVLTWGVMAGMNFDEIKDCKRIIHLETFSSEKKRTGVAVWLRSGEVQEHWKGAAEEILEISDRWVDVDGSIQPMTQDKALELRNNIEGMAAASLRCIAFAYRELEHVPEVDGIINWEIPWEGLIFLSVIGFKDPCRPGVQDAVARCQAAGVKVRMVTGDSVITAKAIAQECGILTKGGEVIEGKVFRKLSDEDLDALLPKFDVMARSSPSDKLLLVRALKARGEVVAVTGDGTNDAPALHDADVGLSMGLAGTEVAKESSDIVILDDNFESIVKVVRWGRSVYANIQKFIQFQLAVNVSALVINFVAAISSGKLPLTAVQLLWVNLIMDTLGALALATEEPTDDLMEKKPVGQREPLITNVTWRNLFGQTIYQIAVLMTIDYGGKKIFRLENKSDATLINSTILFNAFVLCQVFNEVNARRPEKLNIFHGLHKNYLFVGIIFIEVVVQFLIVQFLFATKTSLTWQQWLICVAIASVTWPLGFILKLIPVRETPYVHTYNIRWSWRRYVRKNHRRSTDNVNAQAELLPSPPLADNV